MGMPKMLVYILTDSRDLSMKMRGLPTVDVGGKNQPGPRFEKELGVFVEYIAKSTLEYGLVIGKPIGGFRYPHRVLYVGNGQPPDDYEYDMKIINNKPLDAFLVALKDGSAVKGKIRSGQEFQFKPAVATGHGKAAVPPVRLINRSYEKSDGRRARYDREKIEVATPPSKVDRLPARPRKEAGVAGRRNIKVIKRIKKIPRRTEPVGTLSALHRKKRKAVNEFAKGVNLEGRKMAVLRILSSEKDPEVMFKDIIAQELPPRHVRILCAEVIKKFPDQRRTVTEFLGRYAKWGAESRELPEQDQLAAHWLWGK